MPQIKARLDKELGCDAKLTDPDECVAKGAAIYALNQSYHAAVEQYSDGEIDEKPRMIIESNRTRVVNVTSKSYGTDYTSMSSGKTMVRNMILANTPLNGNCRAEEFFYTRNDNQSSVSIEVYEADLFERDIDPQAAVLLEKHTLRLSKNYPRNTSVKVVFEVDQEGILRVYSQVGGDSIEFEIKLKGVKSADEIRESIAKLANFSVQDDQ
jgi:molecular chaperone DnaK (HSP70)